MATGREARAERLNDRLRGAQRTNVDDDTFNLDLGAIAAPEQPSSSSPAKRRKTNTGAPAPTQQSPRAPTRQSPRTRNPYDLVGTSKASAAQGDDGASNERPRSRQSGPPEVKTGGRQLLSSQGRSAVDESENIPIEPSLLAEQPDELVSSPAQGTRSATRAAGSGGMIDEIEESPINAPGSGQRRSVRASSALASSARLQDAMQRETGRMSSSPLTRKSRRSEVAPSVRSAGSLRQTPRRSSPIEEVDELSPEQPRDDTVVEEYSAQEEEPEDAEEIDETEAAVTIGRKRPRSSLRGSSPQLGEEPTPAPKRPTARKSPATQRQGVAKTQTKAKKPVAPKKPARQPKPRAKPPATNRAGSDDSGEAAIELTVQRFVNHTKRGRNDDDTDPLQLDIPFANRSGESAVDVFAQVCDEVIGNTLEQYQEKADTATDTAMKKELRIKVRAVEAYREVLNSRLLQHTIHLNHWNSLRKRLKHAQKEKLALREDIIRLKAEREQVALRMDAVRVKHEADTKESTLLLNTSNTMRDIDMAVAKGQEAPELSTRAQKEADLANLELAIAQITDQASSSSASGGLLSQIQDFNAFLERSVEALQAR